jgi:hypothetical protein
MIERGLRKELEREELGKMRTSYGQQVRPWEDLNPYKLINVESKEGYK